jgi:glycosyltransferase involved in cell wall biosynthesis
MNILIISFDADPPYMGGTATVANVLAKGFMAKGHFCALGYMDHSEHPSVFFENKVKLVSENRAEAEAFFKKHTFDIILDQLAIATDYEFLKSLPIGNCKIITAYHNRPMLRPPLVENFMRIFHESSSFWYKIYTLAKIPLIPLFSISSRKRDLKNLNKMRTNGDRILLLSEKFFPVWMKLVPNTDSSRLIAIGNPLVFENELPLEQIEEKEKLVIAVCSINSQKRAHLLLKIWKYIENDPLYNDWKFEFIGEGEGYNQILKMAKKLNLKRIKFTGYQDTYPYYKRAAIMMMTSKFEGWPMVLMEGQQMGVVPISYNSYESITDIITDGKNGVIIPNNDMNYFVNKLKELMLNDTERIKIAENSINSSRRFSLDIVTDKYIHQFSEIINETRIISN